MFPYSFTDSDVQLQRHHEALAVAERARLTDQARTAPLRHATGGVIGTVLHHLGRLPCDSREGLRSKERDLAAYGITWTYHLADEEELARQVVAARQRRLAGVAVLSSSDPVARSAVGARLRWGIGNLLVQAGHRLQDRKATAAAA